MLFKSFDIKGLILIYPSIYEDSRGFFIENYNKKKFIECGMEEEFIQDNHSNSYKGVIRGLHYQDKPYAQAKLIRVIRGAIFDVAVDMRRDSPTFGQHIAAELSENNKYMLYIPTGFAHGFCVLKNNTDVIYKTSNNYSAKHDRGILWNDPKLNIKWPKLDHIVSDKDDKWPTFNQFKYRIGTTEISKDF